MFGRRHADLPRQWHRPNKERSASEPELPALVTGTPSHLVAAEVARLQQAVGNRGGGGAVCPTARPCNTTRAYPAMRRAGLRLRRRTKHHLMSTYNETAIRLRVPSPVPAHRQ